MKYKFWDLFFLKRKSFELDCKIDWLTPFMVKNFLNDTQKNIKLSKNAVNIDRDAFGGCEHIENVFIPQSVKFIGKNAFDNCPKLQNIFIKNCEHTQMFSNSFGKNIKYLFHIPGLRYAFIASSELPEQKCDYCVKLSDLTNAFGNARIDKLEEYLRNPNFVEVVKKMSSQKFQIPFSVLRFYIEHKDIKLNSDKEMSDFANKLDFRFLKNEIPNLKDYLEMKDIGAYFLKFAYNLGCFSNEKYVDENGRKTDIFVAQKASSLLAKLLKTNTLKVEDFHITSDIPIKRPCSQECLRFLSIKGEKGEFVNFKLLLKLNEKFDGIFNKALQNFNKVKRFRTILSKNGVPKTVSWEEALKRFYSVYQYGDLAESDSQMAVEFLTKGVEKEEFLKTMHLIDTAVYYDVENHILGEPLVGTTALDKIEVLKNKTQKVILETMEDIDNLYDENFSFEMLDKHSPLNAILGVYCDCCATITRIGYGYAIAANSIAESGIQNLIVRDKNGEIIAKGCMFVNKRQGYAVINDFELDAKYKKGEIVLSGIYDNDGYKEEHLKRTKIFETLMKGIYAFVAKYNQKNPDNPLRQVNVGMGYNRLKQYVQEYPKDKNILPVPQFFEDAFFEQHVLYNCDDPKDAKLLEETEKLLDSTSNSDNEEKLSKELK